MGYTQFFTVRVVVGILIAVIALFGLWRMLDKTGQDTPSAIAHKEKSWAVYALENEAEASSDFEDDDFPFEDDMGHDMDASDHGARETASEIHQAPPETHEKPSDTHGGAPAPAFHEDMPTGVAFVEATVAALEYELNERFWGWRPNDILQLTDNVESMQRGILEVVRRASVVLAERISRYGPTDVIDKNLENAMNLFMIKSTQYWLPSPEDKYNEAIKELRTYAERLEKGEASFYTRADNLIPLLVSLADILGSCDDNLVKAEEKDGSPVSWFKVDDYFYYAKGVATAMGKILHAVEIDFASVLEARGSMDLMRHAIHACHLASELDPWLVTDASLDGVLANHRANMAAPISHARHYLAVLAQTLET
jgi:hypothetical protein